MKISCFDIDGNALDHLTQWDVGQKIRIDGADTSSVPAFHFFNRKSQVALVVPAEVLEQSITASVPNILLQEALPIVACVYYTGAESQGKTSYTVRIAVNPRPKPNDYEYIENIGYDSFIALSDRVKELIQGMENIDFKANETHIQFTKDGVVWEDVVPLADLKGKDGTTPVFSIGTVSSLPGGSPAEATVTGTPENPILNLGIPKGDPYTHSEEFAALAEGVRNDAAAAAGSASAAAESAASIGTSAEAALKARNEAETFATNAKNSESAVHSDAEAAKTAASGAKLSETNASASAQTATTKAEEAAGSASAADGSATAASNSASDANGSAAAAAGSASAAAESARNSSTSAGNAASSALEASGSATSASKSAQDASGSAAAAAQSESNAGVSETNAGTSAQTATTKASEASDSAIAAAGSAANASASEKNAKGSETAASDSASAAAGNAAESKKQADVAVTKASEAAGSASAAEGSATAASTSASEAKSSASTASTAASNAESSATTAAEKSVVSTNSANRAEKAAHDAELVAGRLMPKTWSEWQIATRLGNASKLLVPGDQFGVEKVKSTTASVVGSGVSSASVDKIKFITARDEAKAGTYEFKFDGTYWKEGDVTVNIQDMGISISGSPATGDVISVVEETTEILFDVAGIDYDVPSDPNYTHSITLLAHNCFENCPFDHDELLWYCNPETRPDGLPAGTYNITLDHGSYGDGTLQDGTYQFTTTKVIPAGGGITHTTMGGYQSTYTKDQILGGKFATYNAERATIESGLTTTEGAAGTNLGTASGRYTTHRVGEDINLTERQYYGSNKWVDSAIRQYLNSDKASGWHTLSNKFDRPQTSPVAGFLYGLDPSFVKVLGQVKKRTLVFQTGEEPQKYVDTDELVHLASMTEVGFGANDGVWETPLAGDAPKQEAYPMFKDATNADRIKYLGSSARWWWLRGACPWNASDVRIVHTDGSLSGNGAGNYSGAVPGLCII